MFRDRRTGAKIMKKKRVAALLTAAEKKRKAPRVTITCSIRIIL